MWMCLYHFPFLSVSYIYDYRRYDSAYLKRPGELRRKFCVKSGVSVRQGVFALPHEVSDLGAPLSVPQIVVAFLALKRAGELYSHNFIRLV